MKYFPLICLFLLLPVQQGCRPMMYPFARAFGSPSEGELAKCREAFDRLKSGRATVRVLAHPATDPVGMRREPYAGTAEQMAGQLQENGWGNGAAAASAPAVEATPLLRNQLRYVWTRALLYGTWVKTARPEGDFFMFVEVLSPPSGTVIGVHGYVVDASGQVAYTRLLNSHHFGDHPPKDPEAACRMILKVFLRDLERRAEEIFPPYGVG